MRTLACYALSVGVAAALLASCGRSQPPIGAPGSAPQGRAVVAMRRTRRIMDATGSPAQSAALRNRAILPVLPTFTRSRAASL